MFGRLSYSKLLGGNAHRCRTVRVKITDTLRRLGIGIFYILPRLQPRRACVSPAAEEHATYVGRRHWIAAVCPKQRRIIPFWEAGSAQIIIEKSDQWLRGFDRCTSGNPYPFPAVPRVVVADPHRYNVCRKSRNIQHNSDNRTVTLFLDGVGFDALD